MKQYSILFVAVLIILSSCGGAKKEGDAAINDKKAKLEKLKNEKNSKDEEIRKLQDELNAIDTGSANAAKVKLVAVAPVATENFEHFINLEGKVDADNISYISPRGAPGQVKAIFVKEGDHVKKGQLLLKLDDAVMRQQLVTVKQQAEGLKTQIAFAKNLAQRQQNLWDQGIGTEVQLITAKNNVANLENQLQTANESVKVTGEQLNTANVYSDVNGVADVVGVKVGELFAGMGQIKIVNTSSLKVVTSIPENYLTKLHQGTAVIINIPDANKQFKSTISLISQSIEASNRGFIAEAKIPYDAVIKPNQVAKVQILDYSAANVVVIPINTVQSDEKGKYVYVQTKTSNGKAVATKKTVIIGEVYADKVEIKSGLTPGDLLVTEGYQNIYQGQTITTEVK
ncbi:MAG: efflux RND transporter periplasmic adaptor subunit [Ferruginibacter sp.]